MAERHGARFPSARPYGLIGDALVELGRYDAAFAAFERMVSLRPGLASYARIAHARELVGDRTGAVAAMRLALDAAGGQPEPTAWALVELAKLERGLGRLAAGRHARSALRVVPGYPAARVELARIEAAVAVSNGRSPRRGARPTPFRPLLRRSGSRSFSTRAGRHGEAKRQRATVAVIGRLLEANGVRVDLESAVYRADHGTRLRENVEPARRARAARPSIHGDDAPGWASLRAGRCGDALLRAALPSPGHEGPPSLLPPRVRRGVRGDRPRCGDRYRQALALDAEFSVRWAPVAAAALEDGSRSRDPVAWQAARVLERRRVTAAFLGAVAIFAGGFALASCGGDDGEASETTPETTTTETTTEPEVEKPTVVRVTVVDGSAKGASCVGERRPG